MRILFTTGGGRGHTDPLLPVARAARAVGHTVSFSCRAPMGEVIEAAGFPAFTGGPAIAVLAAPAPLLALDPEREDRVLRHGFARGLAAGRAAAVGDLCQAWRPDVLVCDETDFGALLAAELVDIPYASVVVVAAGSFLRPEVIAEPLGELRAELGLDPDPGLSALTRSLVLSPVPPSFHDPAFPLPPTGHPIRPAALEVWPEDPSAPALRPGTTVVYVTLGTVFNMESGDLFERVLRGVGALPVEVVATVGSEVDPARFRPQPPNVHVRRHVAQTTILPVCDVVVSHAGSGSVLGALAHGLPSVLVPMGADQPFNAARCEALGVGRVLDASGCTPIEVGEAVDAVLATPSYRERARALRDESLALPNAAHAVTLVERLARERRPIVRGPGGGRGRPGSRIGSTAPIADDWGARP